jgi:hypothetical protein
VAKTETKDASAQTADADVIEGQGAFDLPGVASADVSGLIPFVPPAMNQWRRRLREDELLAYIRDQAAGRLADDDPVAIMEMLSGIARATTFEEAVGGSDTQHGASLTDVTIAVYGIKFLKSGLPKGCPFFVLLDAKRTDTGEAVLVDVGGWKLVGTLGWAHYAARELPEGSPYLVPQGTPGAIEKQTYPFIFRIVKEDTSGGNTVNLLKLPHQ